MTQPPSPAIDRLIRSAWIDDDTLASQFIRFELGEHAVGWLTPAFADALARWPHIFARSARSVRFTPPLDTPNDRSRADAILATIVSGLATAGVITGWRDERYPIRAHIDLGAETLLHVERAAARAFGITSDAVHVNGVVAGAGGPRALWIARRSAAKSIDPGMRDNMIGGGVPAGLSIRETLIKEAWEEAGLDAAMAATATAGRRLRIRRIVPEGLQSEVIHVHDLVLAGDVMPCNQDGEVSGFERIDVDGVVALLERDAGDNERDGGAPGDSASEGRRSDCDPMTVDASLVTLDWLERNRFITLPDSAACRAVYWL